MSDISAFYHFLDVLYDVVVFELSAALRVSRHP